MNPLRVSESIKGALSMILAGVAAAALVVAALGVAGLVGIRR